MRTQPSIHTVDNTSWLSTCGVAPGAATSLWMPSPCTSTITVSCAQQQQVFTACEYLCQQGKLHSTSSLLYLHSDTTLHSTQCCSHATLLCCTSLNLAVLATNVRDVYVGHRCVTVQQLYASCKGLNGAALHVHSAVVGNQSTAHALCQSRSLCATTTALGVQPQGIANPCTPLPRVTVAPC